MTVTAILGEIRRRGIELQAHGDRLRYRPLSAVDEGLRRLLADHKAELLAALAAGAGSAVGGDGLDGCDMGERAEGPMVAIGKGDEQAVAEKGGGQGRMHVEALPATHGDGEGPKRIGHEQFADILDNHANSVASERTEPQGDGLPALRAVDAASADGRELFNGRDMQQGEIGVAFGQVAIAPAVGDDKPALVEPSVFGMPHVVPLPAGRDHAEGLERPTTETRFKAVDGHAHSLATTGAEPQGDDLLHPVPVAALDDPTVFEARKRAVGIDLETAHERFQERAAIMEFDGGLDRPEAERLALADVLAQFGPDGGKTDAPESH